MPNGRSAALRPTITSRSPIIITRCRDAKYMRNLLCDAGTANTGFAGMLVFLSRRHQLVALAARYALPTMYPQRDYVLVGRLDELPRALPMVSPRLHLCGPGPQGRQTGRFARGA